MTKINDSPDICEETVPHRFLWGLLLISCSTLLLQGAWTRILSVSLWYHFAFLIISTALLGFGISGVILAIGKPQSSDTLPRILPKVAAGMVISILVGFGVANHIPFAPFSLLADRNQLFFAPLFLSCICVPFVFSGMIVALLFRSFSAAAGKIYFVDLVGAGLGCIAIIIVLSTLGGSGAIVCSAILAAGALIFFTAGRARIIACLLLLLLIPGALKSDVIFPISISPTKVGQDGIPIQVRFNRTPERYTAWNSFSRIDVLPAPYGQEILIDAGSAKTRMPQVNQPIEEMGPIEDERSIVLIPGQQQRVLIIGSGGGWDVLAALQNKAKMVWAIEVNPLINDLLAKKYAAFTGNLYSHPKVKFFTAEARSFIHRRQEKYDVIMASHTISNAATASGAFSLTESYLLTIDAFMEYLARLTPAGLLWISRPEAHLPRLAATAGEALRRRGVSTPGRHLVIFGSMQTNSFSGSLLISQQPFSSARIQGISHKLAQLNLRALFLPRQKGGPLIYQDILSGDSASLNKLYETNPTQLRPATDDQPFFNQRTRFSDINFSVLKDIFTQQARGRMALEDKPVAETTLLVVLVQSLLMTLALIILPLLLKNRTGARGPLRLLLYFICLGLGYILCEIALIQRLTLFLGQPIYTFSVVVGTLLIASGIGSLLTSTLVPRLAQLPRRLSVILAVISLLILVTNFISPLLFSTFLGVSLPLRVLLSILLTAPLGMALGMAFPLGIRFIGHAYPAMIPWAWGLNAVASVVGSVAAIILAMLIGFSGVFLIAAGMYLLALSLWVGPQAPHRGAGALDIGGLVDAGRIVGTDRRTVSAIERQ